MLRRFSGLKMSMVHVLYVTDDKQNANKFKYLYYLDLIIL